MGWIPFYIHIIHRCTSSFACSGPQGSLSQNSCFLWTVISLLSLEHTWLLVRSTIYTLPLLHEPKCFTIVFFVSDADRRSVSSFVVHKGITSDGVLALFKCRTSVRKYVSHSVIEKIPSYWLWAKFYAQSSFCSQNVKHHLTVYALNWSWWSNRCPRIEVVCRLGG